MLKECETHTLGATCEQWSNFAHSDNMSCVTVTVYIAIAKFNFTAFSAVPTLTAKIYS